MGWARFTIVCEECVRIEYAEAADGFVDAPSLSVVSRPGEPVVVEDVAGGAPAVLRTPRFTLEFRPSGRGFTDETLRVEVEGPFAPGGPGGGTTVWRPGDRQQGNLGGTLATLDGLKRAAPLPDGLLSRDGWFLIDDSRGHVFADGWIKPRDEVTPAAVTDWFLLCYGADYAGALRAFTRFAGRVPMPRRCVLGSWYSRYWPHTSEQYRAIVSEYESHGIPLDVVVLDMDWHREGWTGWSWNRDLLPDAEELLQWMCERGVAVTLNLHPADGVGPHEDRYAEFMRAIGRDPGSRECARFDAGDRAYMRALFERVHGPLEESGVDFWWVDWQQEKFVPSVPGLTNLSWLNRLYFEHTRGEGKEGKRGVSFSRWAGESHGGVGGERVGSTGGTSRDEASPVPHPSERGSQGILVQVWSDHRHPIHFSGDAHTGWEMLDFQVPFTVAAGNAGCFFWSHDIGGHFGPRNEEATARWVQFGALSAALRLHSARTEALDRRPWSYARPYFDSIRRAFALRAELMPYIYTQVRACHERALPLLRPMYLNWPMEPEAYRSPRQYMLGADLLAAPITSPGVGPGSVAWREVWFPPRWRERPCTEGTEDTQRAKKEERSWYRWETGERFGSGHAVVSAAIDETPVFVAGGVAVPVRGGEGVPTRMADGEGGGRELTLRVWPGMAGFVGETELYEDDGITRGHEFGQFARTPLRVEWMEGSEPGVLRARVRVGPTEGVYTGQARERGVRIEFGGAASVRVVESGPGSRRSESVACDPRTGLHTVMLPAAPIERPAMVEVELVEADATSLGRARAARRVTTAGLEKGGAVVADLSKTHDAAAIGLGIGLVVVEERPDLGAPPRLARLVDTHGAIESAVVTDVSDAVGRSSLLRTSQEVAWTGGAAGSIDVPLPITPLSPPPLGLRAERRVRATFRAAGREIVLHRVAQSMLAPITAWRVIGPFAWHWAWPVAEQSEGPERGGLDEHHQHVGVDGKVLAWHEARSSARWATDLRASLSKPGADESGLGYAVTTITSARKQESRLHIEASDKVEVWVNGEKVYSLDAFESQAAADAGAAIALRTGRNTLLVKCASGGIAGLGGWGFTAALEGEQAVSAEAWTSGGHPAAG